MKRKKEDYRDMPLKERIEEADNIFIELPQAKRVLSSLKRCHLMSSRKKREPDCLFIAGWPGCGKSYTIDYYLKNYPMKTINDVRKVPVLKSELFSTATVKNLASGLLQDLGDPFYDKGTTKGISDRLLEQLEACDVELIIIDEFQHIIDSGSNKIVYNTADWLKILLNRSRISIVLLGVPWTTAVLKQNSMLRRRFLAPMELKPFTWSTEAESKRFRKFVGYADTNMPLAENSRLSEPSMALRLFCASEGVISDLMRIIKRGMELAVEDGKERIMDKHLATAYVEIKNIPPNPFSVPIEKLDSRAVNPYIEWYARIPEKTREKFLPSDLKAKG